MLRGKHSAVSRQPSATSLGHSRSVAKGQGHATRMADSTICSAPSVVH
ncbi:MULTISPECIES: hypothetical protein [Moorena]|nr:MULTISPECIES: hypothetical protein [Moorena]